MNIVNCVTRKLVADDWSHLKLLNNFHNMFYYISLLSLVMLVDDSACVLSKRIPLTCMQIRNFVDGHNIRRQRVAQGMVPRQPSAANMRYMVWDEELAEKATKWAENGVFGHNPDRAVGSQRWNIVGENVYINYFYTPIEMPIIPNIQEPLNEWFNEHQHYGFEPYSQVTEKPIGHYTQMVWADSSHIGCGISQRWENGWTITLFVCNYAPTGNYFGKVPYNHNNGLIGFLRCASGLCRKPYGKYC